MNAVTTKPQQNIAELTQHWHGTVYDLTKVVGVKAAAAMDMHPQEIVNDVVRGARLCAGDRLVSQGQRNIGEYNWDRSAPSFDLKEIALTMSFDDAAAARAAAQVMGDRVQVEMRDANPSNEAAPIAIPFDQFINR